MKRYLTNLDICIGPMGASLLVSLIDLLLVGLLITKPSGALN